MWDNYIPSKFKDRSIGKFIAAETFIKKRDGDVHSGGPRKDVLGEGDPEAKTASLGSGLYLYSGVTFIPHCSG